MKLLGLILAFSLSVLSAEKVVEETIAMVNGEALYLTDYESNLNNVLEDLKKTSRSEIQPAQMQEIKEKVLNQMVEDTLLYQHAKKLAIKVYEKDIDSGVNEIKARFRKDEQGRLLSEEQTQALFEAELKRQRLSYADFKERVKKQLMVIRLIDAEVKAKAKQPSPTEVQGFFDQMKTLVASGVVPEGLTQEERDEMMKLAQLLKDRTAERLRARHILLKFPPNVSLAQKSRALTDIKKIKADLDKGADFAELAKKHSEDTESATKGGDLGYFIRGWMVPEFEKAAFALAVGKVSEPVETTFGYHVIYVEEKRAASPLRLEELEEDLTQYLFQRNFQRHLRSFVGELRGKAAIKITKNMTNGNAKDQ